VVAIWINILSAVRFSFMNCVLLVNSNRSRNDVGQNCLVDICWNDTGARYMLE
jgi:hypothetical protein